MITVGTWQIDVPDLDALLRLCRDVWMDSDIYASIRTDRMGFTNAPGHREDLEQVLRYPETVERMYVVIMRERGSVALRYVKPSCRSP